MSRLKADALVLVAALIWGVAFYFQKIAMDHVGPWFFVGTRTAIAALALSPFAWREMRRGTAQPQSIGRLSMLGALIFMAASIIQQAGIMDSTVTNTGFLTALYVIFTPFLFWLIRNERPGARVWAAALIAFLGIWALGGGNIGGFTRGDMLVATSAIFWSLYMVVTSLAARAGKPLQYTCLSFALVAIFCLPVAMIVEAPSWQSIADAGLALLYVGVFSSALTFALMAIAIQHIPATRASVLLSTETLFAAAAGAVMLGERLTPIAWAGAALVFAAIVVIQAGSRR